MATSHGLRSKSAASWRLPRASGVAGFRTASVGTCLAAALHVAGSLFFASAAEAQPTLTRRFAADAGLPAVPVWVLAQDSTGFLWLGTEGGLVRFDGQEFRTWAPETVRVAVISIAVAASGEIVALDARGTLYAVTSDGVRELAVPAGAPHRSPRSVTFDEQRRLWMIRGGRIHVREPGRAWRALPAAAIDGESPRLFGATGRGSGVLVATDASVWHLEADGASRRLLHKPAIDVVHLENGAIAALGAGLYVVDDNGVRTLAGPGVWEMPPARPLALIERGSTLWVSFDRFLVAMRAGRPPEVWGPLDGLEAGGAMLVDREGSLWMGTFTALLQLPEPETRIWADRSGLPSAHTRFLGKTDGTLWVTTWQGAGHMRRSPRSGRMMVPSDLFSQYRLCPDPDGSLWMSTLDDALVRLRGSVVMQRHGGIGRLLGCAPAGGGGVWLASSRGLWWTSPSSAGATGPSAGEIPPALADRPVEAVLEDRTGRLWVGASGTICVRGPDAAGDWACDRPGDTGGINEILQLPSGRLWAATERMGVLQRGANGGWHPLPASGRLPTRTVFGLQPARTGGTWVFGHGFVLRVKEEGAQVWRVVERLGAWHGLPVTGGRDLLEEADGTLWITTSLGVIEIPPAARYAEVHPPPVALVEARSGTAPLSASGTRLSHDRNRVALRFAALSFRDPALLRYQIRLSQDDEWVSASGPPSFEWPDLQPGRYRAEFRASLGNGGWSPEPASLDFRVLPPWYREPWALVAFALLAVGALWMAHHVRANFLVRLERQRTRIALDLHDQVGPGLGSMGVLAGVVGRESLEPAARHDIAARIADTAEELGGSLSDIIWTLDPHAATLPELADRLGDHGRHLFADDSVEFTASFPEHWPAENLPIQVRRNLLLIGLEALYNAARHADATRVWLSFRRHGRRLLLVVGDDGRGVDGTAAAEGDETTAAVGGVAGPEGGDVAEPEDDGVTPGGAVIGAGDRPGHGLESMRQRAAEIGADLSIRSAAGRGTTVTVRFSTEPVRGDGRFRRLVRFR